MYTKRGLAEYAVANEWLESFDQLELICYITHTSYYNAVYKAGLQNLPYEADMFPM